ncbi:MAG: hypothetical protein GX429_06855 [Bacteroidales bacterium]|nr:hypothetical protein [Bacteroidales bacterium]
MESKKESKYRKYGNYGKYISVHLNEGQAKELETRVKQSGKTQHKFIIDSLFNSNSNSNEYYELSKVLVKIFIENEIKAEVPKEFVQLIQKIAEDL